MQTLDSWDKLRLDYEQTLAYFHALHQARFRLLALLPVVTGAALATLDAAVAPERVLAIGLFGLLVSLGLTFYDQRNTQIYDAMQIRAKSLEAFLGFARAGNARFMRGGPLLNRPGRTLKFFGVVLVWHDRGLAIVYSAILAGWCYLIVAGAIALLQPTAAPWHVLKLIVPGVLWLAVLIQLHSHDRPTDTPDATPPEVQRLLAKPAEEPWLADSGPQAQATPSPSR